MREYRYLESGVIVTFSVERRHLQTLDKLKNSFRHGRSGWLRELLDRYDCDPLKQLLDRCEQLQQELNDLRQRYDELRKKCNGSRYYLCSDGIKRSKSQLTSYILELERSRISQRLQSASPQKRFIKRFDVRGFLASFIKQPLSDLELEELIKETESRLNRFYSELKNVVII